MNTQGYLLVNCETVSVRKVDCAPMKILTIQHRPRQMTAANTPDLKTGISRIASAFLSITRQITAAAQSMKIWMMSVMPIVLPSAKTGRRDLTTPRRTTATIATKKAMTEILDCLLKEEVSTTFSSLCPRSTRVPSATRRWNSGSSASSLPRFIIIRPEAREPRRVAGMTTIRTVIISTLPDSSKNPTSAAVAAASGVPQTAFWLETTEAAIGRSGRTPFSMAISLMMGSRLHRMWPVPQQKTNSQLIMGARMVIDLGCFLKIFSARATRYSIPPAACIAPPAITTARIIRKTVSGGSDMGDLKINVKTNAPTAPASVRKTPPLRTPQKMRRSMMTSSIQNMIFSPFSLIFPSDRIPSKFMTLSLPAAPGPFPSVFIRKMRTFSVTSNPSRFVFVLGIEMLCFVL